MILAKSIPRLQIRGVLVDSILFRGGPKVIAALKEKVEQTKREDGTPYFKIKGKDQKGFLKEAPKCWFLDKHVVPVASVYRT